MSEFNKTVTQNIADTTASLNRYKQANAVKGLIARVKQIDYAALKKVPDYRLLIIACKLEEVLDLIALKE